MKTRIPKTKIVTGCNDCPFVFYKPNKERIISPHCDANDDESELKTNSLEDILTPPDCPLKTQPIIITYES